MDQLTCRLLPFQEADGPTNMATDEVLLQAATLGVATFRFYGWRPPTLSLGYFQTAQTRLADSRLVQLPWVRRPSGGDTLVHDNEVTYALALPPGPTWQGHQPWLGRMHQIIAAALGEFGVAAALWGLGHTPSFVGPLCFHHFTPGDVLVAGAKIAGSAQRKHRGALLQHGGILYGTSPHTPTLLGIEQLTGITLLPAQICAGVQKQFERATGWQLADEELTAAERETVAVLVQDKYGNDCWNHKR